jgi:hypothetical protein
MDKRRQTLHQLVDDLPEDALRRAEQALKYCEDPIERQRTVERARERLRAKVIQRLHESGKKTGRSYIGGGVGSGSTIVMPDGDFRSSMSGWDDGPVTYYLRGFRGNMFEIYERLELAKDGTKLVLTQRVVGPNGAEQVLTADMPLPESSAER